MARTTLGVRPTRRALANLSLTLPDLGTPLHEIDNAIVNVARTVPEQREAGGAERILVLKDRVWFKVKAGAQRAIVTELTDAQRAEGYIPRIGNWRIGAAGRRQADTPQRDFYDSITRECTSGKTISTVGLLPTEWDWKRLTAEQAIAWRREMKDIVIRLIAMSLTSGNLAVAEFQQHRIQGTGQGRQRSRSIPGHPRGGHTQPRSLRPAARLRSRDFP